MLFNCNPLAVRYSCNLSNLELANRFLLSMLSLIIIMTVSSAKISISFSSKISLISLMHIKNNNGPRQEL